MVYFSLNLISKCVTLVAQQSRRDMQLCNQHRCGSLLSGWSRNHPFLCQCLHVCVRLQLKISLLSTMWPRLSFRFSELMLWILLACVPLNDVGIVSTAAVWSVPQTHSGLERQRSLEASVEQGVMEPHAGRPRDYDAPQQHQILWTYPKAPVEPESEVRDDFRPWKPAMVPHLGLRCEENTVEIEVKQDLWGNGNLIEPDDLTLGGCPHKEHDEKAGMLVFESELHGCGSQKLVWTF